jgi:hypothetical protein
VNCDFPSQSPPTVDPVLLALSHGLASTGLLLRRSTATSVAENHISGMRRSRSLLQQWDSIAPGGRKVACSYTQRL